jgi:hypothetical protein
MAICCHHRRRFPANVLSGFEPSAGGTFFNLNQLQDEYRDEPGSVITADFYHANALLPLPDQEVVRRIHAHLAACEPGFKDAQVRARRSGGEQHLPAAAGACQLCHLLAVR